MKTKNRSHRGHHPHIKKYLIIALSFLYPLTQLSAEKPDFIFENISIEKGLSSRMVYCIIQDSQGFIWIGTDDGLNRYDGYSFRIFKQDPDNRNSISNSNINCCYRTKDNSLWFGTDKGLNRFNPEDETFSRPAPTNDIHAELATQRIRVIYEDRDENLWIGTQNGLFRYDRQANSIEPYSLGSQSQNVFFNIVRTIYEDHAGILWIGTFDGLFRLNPRTKASSHYRVKKAIQHEPANNLILYIQPNAADENSLWLGTETGLCKFNTTDGSFNIYHADDQTTGLSNNAVKHILPLNDKQFFLGTDDGLNLFDIASRKATPYFHDKQNNLSICDNVIWYIFKDDSGIIWFGTNNGISKINTRRKNFDINMLPESTDEVIVNNITTDSEKHIWLATFNGILRKNTTNGQIKKYLYDVKISTNKFNRRIYTDKAGTIWTGTNNGLLYWDSKTDNFKKIVIKESPLLLKYIFGITEDEAGNIWTNVNNGLCKISPKRNQSGEIVDFDYKVLYINKHISHNNREITCLHSDNNGHIWFGISNEGLFNYNIKTEKVTGFRFDPNDKNSINSISISNIFSDKDKNVYIMTDKGICRYNKERHDFTELEIDNYYRQSLHNGIADDQNNLWLTSFLHLLYYDVRNNKTISFDFTHELKNKGFVTNSIFRDKQGKIFLGSYDRYVSFTPREIISSITDYDVKPAIITSIKVFDNDVNWNRNPGNNRNKQEETIHLKYNQNFIKIYFSLLNYYSPANNKYMYMLEGVDKQWASTGGIQNYASYSNLSPGKYIFLLKASNPDGLQSKDITRLKIDIMPPWWKSGWAYAGYSVMVIILSFFIIRTLRSKILLDRQLKQEKIEREKTEEVNTIKLRFFTNISHEFRTPLTLILGPIESLLDQISDVRIREQLDIMKSNAERLLRLINQIMDFRKIENKKMVLTPAATEIVSFTKSIFNMFKEHAAKRGIEFIFDSSFDECIMLFDNDKMEKVIFNLLSNAFKFTPDGGCISISIDRKARKDEEEFIELSVADNGIGINKDEEGLIFERFHQSKNKSVETTDGTGIGLTLCKEFVELHEGKICVRSNNNHGSVFVVLLPVKNEPESMPDITPALQKPAAAIQENENPKLLIIEDNAEMRVYLRKNLEHLYEINEASDGVEGLESIQKSMPDIIVSDLMMPNMNGLELCDKIKSNMVTSHIPFIILTAKINEEATYKGYSYGADDYITKPFSMKLLLVRISNLLEKNRKLQDHYRLSVLSDPQNIAVESSNEKFIHLLVNAIDENIDNFDLNIELLCQKLNITHQQIYRKLKALTGQTVNEFVRTVRLKRAAQLLVDSDMNVSEIMYSVGFSNRSYFSKCFAEEHLMTPKEYRSKHKKSDAEKDL